MAIYCYVKTLPGCDLPKKKPVFARKAALGLVILGVAFLVNAAYPIVSYQLLLSPKFGNIFISPTAEAEIDRSFETASGSSGQEIDLVDLTKAGNWFADSGPAFIQVEERAYKLSVPILGVKDADVAIGGEDLGKSLVQYPGTAVPGRFGNTVIFGHSVLPQFFNPKNYLTIFSTLPSLKQGNEVIIDYDGVKYKYVVEKMIEASPKDLSILAQRYDDSYLTLITCVPPGTYFKRLIVRARLAKL